MRIGIIGHFGGKRGSIDGQTIKTVTFADALERSGIPGVSVDRIDTYYIRHNWLVFIRQMFLCACKDRKIVVLLSYKGRRVMFPALYFLSRILGREIYHYAIGGRLADEVQAKPRWKRYLSAFSANWMESRQLSDKLRNMGIGNAVYMPNFKVIDPVDTSEVQKEWTEPFRFCMFSRVMEEKGILDGMEAVDRVNRAALKRIAELDIYGPVEPAFSKRFETALERYGSQCRYMGEVESQRSAQVLKNYYMLLFPTRFRHEGIPGTIIDAMAAGLPVIAREWMYCREILEDGTTGLIYDFDCPEQLAEKIGFAVCKSAEISDMKRRCIERSAEYSEGAVMERIVRDMGLAPGRDGGYDR